MTITDPVHEITTKCEVDELLYSLYASYCNHNEDEHREHEGHSH